MKEATKVQSGYRLSLWTKLAFGTGHVCNDLVNGVWMNYLLIYLLKVVQMDSVSAGFVMLSGQITAGIATLVVAFFMNYTGEKISLCKRYGKNKSWHLVGTICVLATFPVIFVMGQSEVADPNHQLAYFIVFVVIQSFGWSTVFVAHLSLIPVLTDCEQERNLLTSIRYGATVISYTLVFALTGLLLGFDQDANSRIGPNDASVFRNMALVCVGVGGFLSLFVFHLTVRVKEEDYENHPTEKAGKDSVDLTTKKSFKDWFTTPLFYKLGVTWMATMVFTNMSQVYMPLYIQTTLSLPAVSIAIIPFLMFFSGFIVSLVNKTISEMLGLKLSMILGCLAGLGGSVWILAGHTDSNAFKTYEIYAVAIIIGGASAHMMITTYCLVSNLVGQDSDSSGFVFGCMNMTDQFSNGISMMVIQKLTPSSGSQEESTFYQHALGWTCFVTAALGILAVSSQLSKLSYKKSLKN